MKCPYCAEEIQDEAILCRYCNAAKRDGEWFPPERTRIMEAPKRKGQFTIRSAGVLFILSGLFELGSVTSEIPLAGALRGGAVAIAYHLFFIAVFIAMGIGLWYGKRWGYRLVHWGTLVYTADRALYILDNKALDAYVTKQLSAYREVMNLVDANSLSWILALVSLVSILCWWGFAFYIYLRRDYFLGSD